MQQVTSSGILLFCLSLLIIFTNERGYDDLKMTYQEFKKNFGKIDLPTNEESQRELNFYSNLENLKKKLDEGCEYCGVTIFFDEKKEEFQGKFHFILARMGLLPQEDQQSNQNLVQIVQDSLIPQPISTTNNLFKISDAPTSKNWADEGKVTSVKNQGTCGTCWSFATVAAVESSLILKGEATNFFLYEPDLSEEFLLTCAVHGTCNGGYLEEAIDLAYDKGIPYEFDNPYQAQKGDPSMCSNTKKNVKYTDGTKARYSYYNIGDSQIINMLQTGPVMIAVSADNWEYYGGGTFSCSSNAQINHAVLLVGYDQDKWIIKNQWGTSWGEKGYIYVTRNPLYNCKIGSAVHQLSENSLIFSFLSLLILVSLTFFS